MKGWKTLAANFLSIVVASVEMYTNFVPAEYHMHLFIGLAALNVGLRLITTTPIGSSK